MIRSTAAIAALVFSAGSALADANIRIFHGSPDAPAVDVRINDGLVGPFSNLSFRQASPYVSVPAGTYNAKIVPTGLLSPVVFDGNIPLADNTSYTVAASGLLGGSGAQAFTPRIYIDDNTLDAANARLRFIHLSPDAPAVDIGLIGGGVLFSNVSYGNSGGYISVPGGTYDLEVRLAGTSTSVLALPNIAVSNNTVYTAFAVGLVGNTTLDAQIVVDNVIPAPGALAMLAAGGLVALRRRR